MRAFEEPEARRLPFGFAALGTVVFLALPPAYAGAGVPDGDGDGIADNVDNCVTLANAGQQDTDGDGIGNRCDADLNNDGLTNFGDLAAFKAVFFPNFDANADFNSDGSVSFGDLAIIKQLFNKPPGPAGYANWITDADGDWGDRLNWFPAVVPPAEAYVTIDVASAITVTVDDNTSFACTQVTSEERIVVDGTLAVSGNLLVNDELVLANGGRLADATLLPAGLPLSVAGSTNFNFQNITLAADVTVQNAGTLNLFGGLTLSAGDLILASTGSTTNVIAQESLTIGGNRSILFGGTVVADSTNRIYQNDLGEVLTIGPSVTVETDTSGGQVGLFSGTRGLLVQGTIISDLPGRQVRVEGDALTFDTAGLQSINGGGFRINGAWESGAGDTLAVVGGVLDLLGTWTNNGTITVTDGQINIDGTWINAGSINLLNTPFELDGTVQSAQLGTITSDDTVLLTGTIENAGQTLDVDNLPAGLLLSNQGRINGGTVTGAIGLTTAVSANANLDGVTLATDLNLSNASTLNLFNGLTLAGANVIFGSTGSSTNLVAQGTQTIGGTGELRFGGTAIGDTTNRMYQNTGGEVLTIGANVTVRTVTTGGRVGLVGSTRGMNLLGTLVSDVDGRQIRLEGNPLSFDADNLLASNGGGFLIDGDWTLQAGDTLSVTGGEVDLQGVWTNDGTVVVTDGDLQLDGTWDNNGTITASNSIGELDGNLATADLGTINSDGVVELTATVNNSAATLDLDTLPSGLILGNTARINGGTITGSGTFGTGISDTVNLDDVILDVDFLLNNASTLNVYTGLTLMSNATFTLASAGSSTSVVAQGTLTVDGNGRFLFGGTTTTDTTNRLYANTGLTLTFGPDIDFQTATAGGRIGLENSNRGIDVQGSVDSDLAGRVVRIEGNPLNFRGDLLTASNGGEYRFGGEWDNDEIITLSDSAVEIEGTWSNSGQINLTNTPLELDGTTTTAGIGIITSDAEVQLTGTVDNSTATLNVDALPATFIFANQGRINGGTISGTAGLATLISANVSLDGVTLATDFTINNAASLNIYNGLTLSSSTIDFQTNGSSTNLIAQGTQTLGGAGTLSFGGTTVSDTANRIYTATGSQTLTLGAGVTVETDTVGGRIGLVGGSRGITVLGAVISDLAGRKVRLEGNPLAFDADNLIATGGGGFYINGDWTLQAGDTLSVDGGEVDLLGGTWENAGTVEVMNGDLNLEGTWSNSGTIDLTNTPLELDGNVTTAGLGTILSDSTVTLTATLDNAGSTLDTDTLPADFDLGLSAYIDGGAIDGIAGLSVASSATADFDGVNLSTDLTINNAGILELSGGLTLSGGSITMASAGSTTRIRANEGLTIGGAGEIVFAGTALSDTANRIDLIPSNSQVLTFGPDVIVRTDTTGGLIGSSSNRGVTIQGQLISNVAGREVRLQAIPLVLDGAVSIGEQSEAEIVSSDLDMTNTGALDIDIASLTDFGFLDAGQAVNFDGDLNLTLIGGYTPAECDEFIIGGYTSRTGTFDNVNGPDFGGGQTFEVFYDATELRIRRPGGACP